MKITFNDEEERELFTRLVTTMKELTVYLDREHQWFKARIDEAVQQAADAAQYAAAHGYAAGGDDLEHYNIFMPRANGDLHLRNLEKAGEMVGGFTSVVEDGLLGAVVRLDDSPSVAGGST